MIILNMIKFNTTISRSLQTYGQKILPPFPVIHLFSYRNDEDLFILVKVLFLCPKLANIV